MRKVFIIVAALVLTGCGPSGNPTIVVPQGPVAQQFDAARQKEIDALKEKSAKQQAILQSVAGDVYGVTNAATHLEPSNATEAVKSHAEVATAKLPEPTAEQKLAKEQENTLFLTGQLELAKKSTQAALTEAQKLKSELSAAEQKAITSERISAEWRQKYTDEQTQRAADLKKLLKDKDDAVKQARDEAYSERNEKIFYGLLGLGAICALAAVGIAVATQGTQLVRSAIAGIFAAGFFGSAKLISHPWFNVIFGSLLALGAIAAGIFVWYDWKSARGAKTAALATSALQKFAAEVDKLKQKAPEAAKLLVQDLKVSHDSDEKELINSLRVST